MISYEIDGQIANLAFGGAGILKNDGLVTFVPFTAPMDEVRVQVIKRKKNYAEGQIIAIHKASPLREEPRCHVFGKCGGCQLQHLRYETQMEAKTGFVRDALVRIAKLPGDVNVESVPADEKYAYRRHIRLKLFPNEQAGFSVNYVGENVPQIQIQACPIFALPNSDVFGELSTILSQLDNSQDSQGHVQIMKANDGFLLDFHFQSKMPPNVKKVLEKAISLESLFKGARVRDFSSSFALGQQRASFKIDDLRFEYGIDSFVQVHPQQSEKLYRAVIDILVNHQAMRLLDLYCGLGVTSVLAARSGMSVHGMESNENAIELARANALRNGLGEATFTCAKVEDKLGTTIKSFKPDAILINPPRGGVDSSVVDILCKTGVPHLIYVSCMPPTLARDVKVLTENGYELIIAQAFDMFPQTTHVETLVYLRKSS